MIVFSSLVNNHISDRGAVSLAGYFRSTTTLLRARYVFICIVKPLYVFTVCMLLPEYTTMTYQREEKLPFEGVFLTDPQLWYHFNVLSNKMF